MSQQDGDQNAIQYKFSTEQLSIKEEPEALNEDTPIVHNTEHMDTGGSEDYFKSKKINVEVVIKEEPGDYIPLEPIVEIKTNDKLTYEPQLKSAVPSENETVERSHLDSLEAEQNIKKKCDNCNKIFSKLNRFESHVCLGQKPNKCITCGKEFNRSDNLRRHVLVTHTEIKAFMCTLCDKSYKRQNSLNIHLRTHTGERRHKCDSCDLAFNELSYLKRHVRLHTGEKPYKCSSCDLAFNQRYELQVHLRTHSGEQPYKCDECGRRFNRADYFHRHVRDTHAKEKRFKCNKCDRAYKRLAALKFHMHKHIGT